ncbi:glycosyltransferase [Acidiferrimicrobium sp. IK]|uniref:glycosyltransferase n=1 Tax=Acidiferrimicrobium sp. IK TaxID=2871700 RepID=UPI0021CB1105|nr:glycosyltransferase [Acidiferrimicrobium sp. IK]MCU4183093.1 glycosyltransferase [Acidiferrimicrobium sp. IK]
MRVLLWHVHGSWTTSFVQGPHRYILPVLPDRGPDGLGRAVTWDWPPSVVEAPPSQLRDEEVDVVVLQRPQELGLVADWLGRTPGRDLPAVYLEHNAPDGPVADMRHPLADRSDIPVVHVTWFNQMFWDTGAAPSRVIEHGVVDPGARYTGELARAAAVINDPMRRGRVTGTDLVSAARAEVGVDLFGMRSEPLDGVDLPQHRLHDEMARRRVYFHPNRWTSLGLSLIEAMHLGMPVVALSTTEAAEVIPSEAGVITNRLPALVEGLRRLVNDPDEAAAVGRQARQVALERFGLARFLADWDRQLLEVTT